MPTLCLLLSVACADKAEPSRDSGRTTPDTRATVLTGPTAFVESTAVTPGTLRKLTPADLPNPFHTESATTQSRIVSRPEGMLPQAPPGFRVNLFAEGLVEPRAIRVAPNGDVFVVESRVGRIHVFRGITDDGKARERSIFATGFHEPYGIAFHPPGANPQWVYVANTDSVVRYAYKSGDLVATGKPETIVAQLPSNRPRDKEGWLAYDAAVQLGKAPPDHGHWTRDLAFSLDGARMFVGVGSASNNDDPDEFPREHHRAAILEYTPAGTFVKVYGSGIRNATGIAVDPATGQLWASVNERDGLGDNLVPDYITHVEEADSTVGLTSTLAATSIRGRLANIPSCGRRRSFLMCCCSRTPRPCSWPSTTGHSFRQSTVAISSRASTARGIERCDRDTRSCACLSTAADRTASTRTSSPAFSRRAAMSGAARSALGLPPTGRFSCPTMDQVRSGGSVTAADNAHRSRVADTLAIHIGLMPRVRPT